MFARIRLGLSVISIIAAIIQLIFFLDGPNLYCIVVTLGLSLIAYKVIGKPIYVQEFPLSTISVLLFIFSSLTLPLVVSSIEFRPITRNLVVPIDVISYVALTVITVLIAHWIYRGTIIPRKARQFLSEKVNRKFGLFKNPGYSQLWMMGIIGVLCLFYKAYALQTKGAVGNASILSKVITGMIPFAYAPFLIPFSKMYSTKPFKVTGKIVIPLLIFFGPIVAAAVLRNDRSDFAMAPVIMLLALAIGLLTQRIKLIKINFKVLIPAAMMVIIVYPLLADLAIAMIIVRKQYGKQGAREQVDLTLELMTHREDIKRMMDMLNTDTAKVYDESYYNSSNVFLDRFANLKFHDNSLVEGYAMNDGQLAQLADFSFYNALAGFPDPVLRLMGIDMDKTRYNTMSVGDYFLYLNTGTGLGGFKVGSVIGHGITLFGMFFFPIFGCIIICYFCVIDGLTYRRKVSVESIRTHDWRMEIKPVYGLPFIAPMVLLNALDMLNPYRWGSLAEIPLFILRDMPQNIFLYVLIFTTTGWVHNGVAALKSNRKHDRKLYASELPVRQQ